MLFVSVLFIELFISSTLQPVLPTFKRPWQSSVPPLTESSEKVVKYPADDETNGIVMVAWRGPMANVSSSFIRYLLYID